MNEKINPQSLKPAHLMRLLNTAGLGTVLTEHRLRRHRNRAGYAIGTEKTINLFKYAAWLTHEYFREKQAPMDYVEKKRIQTAEKAIAKGIGFLIAKMEGLDPSQMSQAIEDDYNRQARQREAEKSNKLTEVQTQRDAKMASLKTEKEGTLDTLRSDFERQAGERTGQFDGKIAA